MEGFDITEFAKMFDAALASDNPAVKKALRNFMMVAAIVHAQELNEDERLAGPFEALLKKVQDLESMVREIQRINNSSYKEYRINPWDYTHTGPTTRAVSTTSINTSINTSTSEGIELLKEYNLK
jgi:hypothetical protein